MSNRKKRRPKPHTLILEVGKFYNAHDRSNKGHPCRIEMADYKNDLYLSITTGSLTEEECKNGIKRKDYYEMSHKTSNNVYKSLINKRPFLGTRDDYGDKEFEDMSIHFSDEPIVIKVLKKTPRQGYWLKKKNKKPSK